MILVLDTLLTINNFVVSIELLVFVDVEFAYSLTIVLLAARIV